MTDLESTTVYVTWVAVEGGGCRAGLFHLSTMSDDFRKFCLNFENWRDLFDFLFSFEICLCVHCPAEGLAGVSLM